MKTALGKEQAALFAAILLSTILFSFFLGQAVSIEELYSFELLALTKKAYSTSLWLFVLTAPLPLSMAIVAAKRSKKKNLVLFALAASAAGLFAADALLPSLRGFMVVQLFYLLSIPLAIETASLKFSELKKWVLLRGVADSFKKSVMLVGIGLLLTSFLTIAPQQDKYSARFEAKLMESILQGAGEGRLGEQISGSMAGFAVQSQRVALASVASLPGYKAIEESQDPEDQLFATEFRGLQRQIESTEYRDRLKDALAAGGGKMGMETPEYKKLVKENIPFLSTVEQFLWLFHGLLLLGLFSLVGNIIMVPLAILYGLALEKTLFRP
jgi:hypothetical protein